MREQPSVFLCHSSSDKIFVRRLHDHLRGAGIRVWLDEAELAIGDSLIQRIETALAECDYVCIVLSKRSLSSEWVNRELRAALAREFSQRRAIVLPILLERVTLPVFLADKLYADFTTAEAEAAAVAQLVAAVYKRPASSSLPTRGDISADVDFQKSLRTILMSVVSTKAHWAPSIPSAILNNAMRACALDAADNIVCVFDLENAWFWKRAQTAIIFTARGAYFGGQSNSKYPERVHTFVSYGDFPSLTIQVGFHHTNYGRTEAQWRSLHVRDIDICVPITVSGINPDDVVRTVAAVSVLVRRYTTT